MRSWGIQLSLEFHFYFSDVCILFEWFWIVFFFVMLMDVDQLFRCFVWSLMVVGLRWLMVVDIHQRAWFSAIDQVYSKKLIVNSFKISISRNCFLKSHCEFLKLQNYRIGKNLLGKVLFLAFGDSLKSIIDSKINPDTASRSNTGIHLKWKHAFKICLEMLSSKQYS